MLSCAPDEAITRAPWRCSQCPGEMRSLHWVGGCKYPPAISLANHPCLEALHKPETDSVLKPAMLCAGVVLAAEHREREEANPTIPHEGCPRPWLRDGGPVVGTEQGERSFSSVHAGAEGAGARGKSRGCSQQPQGQILGSVAWAASAGCLLVVLIVTGSFRGWWLWYQAGQHFSCKTDPHLLPCNSEFPASSLSTLHQPRAAGTFLPKGTAP